MGVLPDHEIEKLAHGCGRAVGSWSTKPIIDPYEPGQLAPSSYDVRLAPVVKVPQFLGRPIDLRKRVVQETLSYDMRECDGWMLKPGGFVLGSTVEMVDIPHNLVCRIEGKSSLARAGLQIHSAGYIDPGYRGTVTLEITNFGPDLIWLWPDVLIAQLSFEFLDSPCREPYQGRYQGSRGAVESRYGA